MARQPQSTIRNDPLEASDPVSLILGGPPKKQRQEAKAPREELERRGQRKEKLTVHVTHDLAERVKNAAYWNPRLTIAAIAERGLAHMMEEIERQNGGPYRPREEELKGGRPIGK